MIMADSLHTPPSSQAPLKITEENFMAEIVEASREKPVIVDFWAPWCEPCKQLTPLLDVEVKKTAGRVRLGLVNIEENASLIMQLEQLGLPLKSIPVVVAFWKGQVVELFQGLKPQSFIEKFIAKLLKQSGQSLPVNELLTAASQALKDGQAVEATALYSEILENALDNPSAWSGLIRALIALNDFEAASEAFGEIPASIAQNAEILSAQNALNLALKGREALKALAQLRQEVAENPSNIEAHITLAHAYSSNGEREEAAHILLTLLKQDMNVGEGQVKKELLGFFEVWGMTDPVTLKMRRVLSALLFS